MQGSIKSVVRGMAALVCTVVIVGFPGGGTGMLCEAKTEDTEKEVVDFVTSYYEAQTPEGIGMLADFVAEPESLETQEEIAGLRAAFAYGLIDQENISVIAYPMSDGKHWIASVGTEWIIQGYDVGLPGMKVELVGRNQDGELQIESYDSDEWDDVFYSEVRELCLSDEMVDRNNEIAMRYNEILAENPDITDWMMEATEEVSRAKWEAHQTVYGQEDDEGKSDGGESRYMVKKGDCLWTIAEEQFGDGMRWSDIYETNKTVIGKDPNLIHVGIELTLK